MIDYHDMVDINTSVEERRKLNIGDIWRNEIKCLKCNDVIRSTNRHHMEWCSCKSCAIDGGSWYAKIVGDVKNIEDRIIYFNEEEV